MGKIIKSINVDMDDVMFDWQGYIGMRLPEFDEVLFEFPRDDHDFTYMDRNIVKLNTMDPVSRNTLLRKLYSVYPNVFQDIWLMDGIKEMLITLSIYAKKHNINLNVLSAIGEDHPNPDLVRKHKLEALEKHSPVEFDNIKIVSTSKCKIGHNEDNCILIDDFKRNILEWENVGGIGIHHTCPKKTILDLAKIIS